MCRYFVLEVACHDMSSDLIFLMCRYFVYAVAASSLTMVWQVDLINIFLTFMLVVVLSHSAS